MNKLQIITGAFALLLSSNISAAPVAIDSMFVDSASASLTIGGYGPYTATTDISPPAEITMGSFQSSIFSVSSTDFSLNIYSTDLYGAPAPSGSVDGTAITVDFSSLRGNLTYQSNTFDFELWPLTTALDYGTFDPLNNGFSIGWTETLSLDLSSWFSTTAVLDVNLQGNLTTVPLPAAIWLFASGMLTIFGFTCRRKTEA